MYCALFNKTALEIHNNIKILMDNIDSQKTTCH